MATYCPRIRPRRAIPWLLWLALLLPVAQFAAASHSLSHLAPNTAARDDGKQRPADGHCNLCLSASAVSGGAPLGHSPASPLTVAAHAPPAVAVTSVWLAPPAPAYLGRAPPTASH